MSQEQAGIEGQLRAARQAITRCGFTGMPWQIHTHNPETLFSDEGDAVARIYDPIVMRALLSMPALLEASLLALGSLKAFAAIARGLEEGSEVIVQQHVQVLECALRSSGIKIKGQDHGHQN